MRPVLFLILTTIILSGNLFGQNVPAACPVVSITGVSGIPEPDVPFTYKAHIDGDIPSGIEFKWSVSDTITIKTQNGAEIEVIWDEKKGDSFSVTLEVIGLPSECPNKVTDSAVICRTEPILIDEFSTLPGEIASERLVIAVEEQKNYPTNQLYIIEYFPAGTSQADIDEKIRRVKDVLVDTILVDRASITFVTQILEGHEYLTKIYRVPPGAENPTP